MPTYGRKKIKDMVRSVLPSTRGKATQVEKKIAKKVARSKDAQALKTMTEHQDEYDDYVDEYKKRDVRINQIVDDRRLYDKVAPLKRWAKKATKGKHDARLAQLSAMMPKNTIGRHAIGHVKHLDEFENPNDPSNFVAYRRKRTYVMGVDRVATLKSILSDKPWLHAQLNAAMKACHRQTWVDGPMKNINGVFVKTHIEVGPTTSRCLKGVHDIDAFVNDVVEASRYIFSGHKQEPANFHPEWLQTLDKFISVYK